MDRKHKSTEDSKEKKIEDYEPGATQTQVLKALKKVAKSPKPSEKHA
jgi:hypothetical protein